MGPSDHLAIDIQISALPIIIHKEPILDTDKTNWDLYKNILELEEEINLDGASLFELHNAYIKLYERIQYAKSEATPTKTIQQRHNLTFTLRFKRLTKILDKYSKQLLNGGKTEHLDRTIRLTQQLLISEGNLCKAQWWQDQILKVEEASRNNNRFWKRINLLSGKLGKKTSHLKYTKNGVETTTKSDNEKNQVFSNTWKNVYKLTDVENRQFDNENELKSKPRTFKKCR